MSRNPRQRERLVMRVVLVLIAVLTTLVGCANPGTQTVTPASVTMSHTETTPVNPGVAEYTIEIGGGCGVNGCPVEGSSK
jgi:hypothetical protein